MRREEVAIGRSSGDRSRTLTTANDSTEEDSVSTEENRLMHTQRSNSSIFPYNGIRLE